MCLLYSTYKEWVGCYSFLLVSILLIFRSTDFLDKYTLLKISVVHIYTRMYILRGDKLVKLAAERSHFTRAILIRKKYGLVGISLQKKHISECVHKSSALSLLFQW